MLQRIVLKFLSKLRLMPYLNLTFNANGMAIPIVGGMGYTNYYGTEKWMGQLLQKLLNYSKDCFVDVGVNLGQTLIKLRSLNKNIEYVGFEPNPVCVFYVEKLIQVNRFINCKVIPAGVSNKTEVLTLKIFANDTDPMASIIEDFKDQAKAEKAVVVIGNNLLNEFSEKTISILKIDVEGAELYVLEGFIGLIKRDRPFITMEILPCCSINGEYSGRVERQEKIQEHIKGLQYAMLRIMKTSNGELKELSLIEDIGKQTDEALSDYVFVPQEKLSQLITQ
jgi:FkbM family methyltransferase